MAASVNKAIVVGFLGAKPDLKYVPSGTAVCEMRVATNEVFTDKKQQRKTRTEWHRVVAWGKTGENAALYLNKGRQVYVEGRLQTRSWTDKRTGEARYATEIIADKVVFLGGGGGPPGARSNGESERDGEGCLPQDDSDIPF